jgi:hypothetical protein
VLIASGYDGAADTIVPRLLEHGADLRRVHFLEGFARADAYAGTNDAGPSGTGAHLLLTPDGVPLLERALRPLPEVKLVVFDPVSAFLDSAGNGTKARHVLSALQALAERCGAAFVLVAGLRDSAAKGRLAVAGPAGLVSAARHLWVVARDRTAEQRRLFMPAKNNLGGESRGYAWTIAGGKVRWEPGQLERAGYFDTLVEAGHRSVARDDRTSSEGDIADFFGAGEIGLPNLDGPSFESLPPLPAGVYDDDEDEDEEDFDYDNVEEDDEELDAEAGDDVVGDEAGDNEMEDDAGDTDE